MGAGRYRYLRSDFVLESFQDHLLEFIGLLLCTKPFVGSVGELLRFVADESMKLDFEPLASTRLGLLTADPLVLVT